MTTRSVEELRRDLRRRPEFQQRPPARRTFQDFVPDYAQAAGASKLPSRAAAVAPRPTVQNTVPDYVQAARMAATRAAVPAQEAPFAPRFDPRAVRPTHPNDYSKMREYAQPARAMPIPAGEDPGGFLGFQRDYYFPSGAELHGPDELVPNPQNFEMFGQLKPQRTMFQERRRLQTRVPEFIDDGYYDAPLPDLARFGGQGTRLMPHVPRSTTSNPMHPTYEYDPIARVIPHLETPHTRRWAEESRMFRRRPMWA